MESWSLCAAHGFFYSLVSFAYSYLVVLVYLTKVLHRYSFEKKKKKGERRRAGEPTRFLEAHCYTCLSLLLKLKNKNVQTMPGNAAVHTHVGILNSNKYTGAGEGGILGFSSSLVHGKIYRKKIP